MLDFIRISPVLRNAFCDDDYIFEICGQIPLESQSQLEELFPNPGVYILHGRNSEILSIHQAIDSIGHHFQEHVDGYSINSVPAKMPESVSAIILNSNSASFAPEIKQVLQEWLNSVY